MKSRGLVVAATVLLALTGTLYWSDHHKPKEDTTSAADAPPKILTLDEASISKIDIKKKGSDEIALAQNDAGKWQMTAPKPFPVDQDTVTSMLSTLSSLNSNRLVEDKSDDLKQYGLTEPVEQVDVTTKDNKTRRLLIGGDTPTGSAVFAMLAGDPRVFTIASYSKTNIDKGVTDLRDKRLLTADFDKLSQIVLVAKKQEIEFGRNKEAWQILKPKPLRADNFQVEDLARKLKDAKAELGASDAEDKKAASAFAGGSPVATAKVTDSSGTQELQIRKSKDNYYAKSTAVPGVYKVGNVVGLALDKGLDDFRNKKLFDFGYEDPNKVEMHDGAKSYFLTKGGQDWWSDGKKMDSSADSLVSQIRDLSASKFPDSGFTSAVIEITVTSKDNKQTEKVLISKNGDRYVAKRDNEPALYELNPAAVQGLEKAAAELKPVPAPTTSAPANKK
jgi:Domain of unknown function (DUF4340)